MVKETPILFSTPMVIAVDNDTKTQTRRTRGLEPVNLKPDEWILDGMQINDNFIFHNKQTREEFWVKCPYGGYMDLLWVRETWLKFQLTNDEAAVVYEYKASSKIPGKWKPSIHMPKTAARNWLEIAGVRIERLQSISHEDAEAEGIERIADGFKNYLPLSKSVTLHCWPMPYHSFQSLWESINGSESWDLNPWVWVITFKRIAK